MPLHYDSSKVLAAPRVVMEPQRDPTSSTRQGAGTGGRDRGGNGNAEDEEEEEEEEEEDSMQKARLRNSSFEIWAWGLNDAGMRVVNFHT